MYVAQFDGVFVVEVAVELVVVVPDVTAIVEVVVDVTVGAATVGLGDEVGISVLGSD